MNLTQRLTLFFKGNFTALLDSVEDPERSLNQLVLEMEDQLEVAKRAAASAMANEDRLRARIDALRDDARRWDAAARRALAQGQEDDLEEAVRQCELAGQQAERLEEQLADQERDTEQIRDSISRLQEQLREARSRLQVLHARLRQGEARRAIGKVLRGAESADLYGEFERLGECVELRAAEENAYLRLGDELSGRDLRRRRDAGEVDDAVERRIAELKAETGDAPAEDAG